MNKDKMKNIIVIIITIVGAIAFLTIYKFVNNKSTEDSNILKISYSVGGGLLSYEQYLALPNIEITNDLKVTLKPGSGKSEDYKFKTYTITQEEYNDIVKQINESSFMLLPDNIEEKGCMDGGSSTINIKLKDKEKKVHIYCKQNERFDKVADAIIKNINKKNEFTEYYNEIKNAYNEK